MSAKMRQDCPENRMVNFYIDRPEFGPVVHAIFTDTMDELIEDPESYMRENLTLREGDPPREQNEKYRKKRQKKSSKRRQRSKKRSR